MAELQKNNDIPTGVKKEDLKAIGEVLPKGAVARIAEKHKCSHTYVSRFFAGDYAISSKNIKILDYAKAEIQNDKSESKQKLVTKANEKIAEILAIKNVNDAD